MPTLDRITLQFSTTPLWQSGVIRLLSHSHYSHVDVVIPPGFPDLDALTPKPYGLLGSSEPGGVMIRPPDYHEFKTRRRLTLLTDKADKIVRVMATQIGKEFDEEALYKVVDLNWRDWRENGKWFCSELVTWSLEQAGYFDYEEWPIYTDKNRVSPGDLVLLLRGRYDPREFQKEVTDA